MRLYKKKACEILKRTDKNFLAKLEKIHYLLVLAEKGTRLSKVKKLSE